MALTLAPSPHRAGWPWPWPRPWPLARTAQAFFRAHAALEAQKNSEAVEAYGELLRLFPRSGYVKSQLALAQYNLREFEP